MTGQASRHPRTKEVKCPSRSRPDRPGGPDTTPRTPRGLSKEATTTHPRPPKNFDPPGRLRHLPAASRRLARRALTAARSIVARPASPAPRRPRTVLRHAAWGVAIVAVLLFAVAPPAAAASAPSLSGVISNLTNWIVGILAGVATLFLTIGGLRYLTAGGDPGQVEKAKIALKSAAVGYALAILAPLLVSIVTSIVS